MSNFDYYIETNPRVAESVTAELHKFGGVVIEPQHLECADSTKRFLIPISEDFLDSCRNPQHEDAGFLVMCFYESIDWDRPKFMDENVFRERDRRFEEIRQLVDQKRMEKMVMETLKPAAARIDALSDQIDSTIAQIKKILLKGHLA